MAQRIIIKIGSQVLCTKDGQLNEAVLSGLVGQVSGLVNSGWQVLLVSSGAVAAGSGLIEQTGNQINDPVIRRQVLAATGQVRLMETYQSLFRDHAIHVAQVLACKADFQTRHHYLNMRACIEALLGNGIIPIVNENDVVTVTELMFTDNDELAAMMAAMINADLLCLLSNVSAVYDRQPNSDQATPIAVWDDQIHQIEEIVQQGTSVLGRGGMHSKLAIARKCARLGTEVVIADGAETGILEKILAGQPVGTRFPAQPGTTPAKRWLASADSYARGYVVVNPGAATALLDSSRLTSLLPVGIVKAKGKFKRGDVIQIRDQSGNVLGCGRARFNQKQVQAMLGQHGHKPVIHYDYLFTME